MVDTINRDVKNLSGRRRGRAKKIASAAAILGLGLAGGYLQNRSAAAARYQETKTAIEQQKDASAEFTKYQRETRYPNISIRKPAP